MASWEASAAAIARSERERARKSQLLCMLPDDVVVDILERASAISLPRGKILFEQGSPADSFFFVLHGWMKLYRTTEEGAETVIMALTEGESFAEPLAIMNAWYPVSAEAATDARVMKIPMRGLQDELRRNPELGLAIIASCFRFLRELVARIERTESRTGPQRLAMFLLDLADQEAGTCQINLPHQKRLLAARLGMFPESLSRSFAMLRKHGVRALTNQATIENLEELRGYTSKSRG